MKTSESTKRVREVVPSNLPDILVAANTLIGHMVTKQVLPAMDAAYKELTELGPQEVDAYNAALAFLKRTFNNGPTRAYPIATEISYESSYERAELDEVDAP
jgi:hypothetical protein